MTTYTIDGIAADFDAFANGFYGEASLILSGPNEFANGTYVFPGDDFEFAVDLTQFWSVSYTLNGIEYDIEATDTAYIYEVEFTDGQVNTYFEIYDQDQGYSIMFQVNPPGPSSTFLPPTTQAEFDNHVASIVGLDYVVDDPLNDTVLESVSYWYGSTSDLDDYLDDPFPGQYDYFDVGQGNDYVNSGAGDDVVLGGEGNDTLLGGDGTDILEGGSGDDTVDGGDGDDLITDSGSGNDTYIGGNGTDTLYIDVSGAVGNPTLLFDSVQGIFGLLETTIGRDTISEIENFIMEGPLDAHVTGGDEDNTFITGSGDDVVYGGAGDDYIQTLEGDDRVYTGSGDDEVILGDGDDYVRAGGGEETFIGGAGNDYISYYDSANGITADLEANTISGSWAVNDAITGFEGISGSRTGDDVIYGTSGANTIRTYGGDDRVYSRGGTDTVELGSGDDYVRVGGGAESFDGGSGTDYISYYDSTNGITANLAENTISGSWAVNDTINSFEGISGSRTGDDVIYGTSGANIIRTYGGDDRVYAGGGTDVVELGSGNDYVRVGGGVESFDGGSGTDYISYYDSSNGITIDLAADTVSGSWAVNDTVINFEDASGSGTGDDAMYGSSGANTLRGFGGDDRLYGRSGDDRLYGGSGNDRFDGGNGTDRLWGGSGADTFHLDFGEGHDIIEDFENNVDLIQLDNFTFANGQDAFDFATQVGDDVVFDFGGGDGLTVRDVTIGQLQNDLVLV